MEHRHPHESAGQPAPLIPGTVLYYPAVRRGRFPSVRAALASIGCTGAEAEAAIAEARVSGSDEIAVTVTHAEDQYEAVIEREPGGSAVLWLGSLSAGSADWNVVAIAAKDVAEESGSKIRVFVWVRQLGAVQ